MKVSECIEAYYTLSAELFDERTPNSWNLPGTKPTFAESTGGARSQRLRVVTEKIIDDYLPANEKAYLTVDGSFEAESVPLLQMRDVDPSQCKVYDYPDSITNV